MTRRSQLLGLALALGGLAACSTQPAAAPAPAVAAEGLTVTSVPANGARVSGPVNKLVLDFSQPVALGEVLVQGPDGLMPMMLSPAGLQRHFEVPLPGLTQGSYTVQWKAQLNGATKSGSLTFTVA